MPRINRYDGNLKAFASEQQSGERTVFGRQTISNDLTSQLTSEFLRGWGIVGPGDEPSLQDFNAAMYTHGQILAYLHQLGIPEWNQGQEYFFDSVVNYSGLWRSITPNNVGNTPSAGSIHWVPLGSQLLNIRVITAPGSSTYSPTPGTKRIRVRVAGGGGAGSGAPATGAGVASLGGSGSAGSYAEAWITSGFSGLTVTVGAGGAGALGVAGGGGGSSSIGTLVTAPGGVGGAPQPSITSSAVQSGAVQPSSSVGGNILGTRGSRGTPGIVLVPTVGVAGNGGAGLVGTSISNGGDGSFNAPNTAASVGNSGAPGIVIIEEYS